MHFLEFKRLGFPQGKYATEVISVDNFNSYLYSPISYSIHRWISSLGEVAVLLECVEHTNPAHWNQYTLYRPEPAPEVSLAARTVAQDIWGVNTTAMTWEVATWPKYKLNWEFNNTLPLF